MPGDFDFDANAPSEPVARAPNPTPRRPEPKVEPLDDEPVRSSRYGSKVEKKPPSPWLYIGLGGGGMAVIAGAIITILLVRGDKEDPNKDKPKPAPVVVQQPPPKKETAPVLAPDALPDDIRERVKRSTVYIRVLFANGLGASGSGFVEKSSKYVVTNAHVVGIKTRREKSNEADDDEPPAKEKPKTKDEPKSKDGKEPPKGKDGKKGPSKELGRPLQIELIFNSGLDKEFTMLGRLKAYDADVDLAVIEPIRLNPGENPVTLPEGLTVPKETKLVEQQKLYIFGFPLGERLGKEMTISSSNVTSLRRKNGRLNEIQVQGGMTRGNSGGPITDTKGFVVGVSVAGYDGTDINLAIPGEAIIDFFKRERVE